MTIVKVLWSSEFPTESGYYWISRGMPGENIFLVQFDGGLFKAYNADRIKLTNAITSFGAGQWFAGPIYPPRPASANIDSLPQKHGLAAEVYSAANQLNEAIKRCGEAGLDVDIDNAECGLPDGRKVPHLIAKVSLELSGETE